MSEQAGEGVTARCRRTGGRAVRASSGSGASWSEMAVMSRVGVVMSSGSTRCRSMDSDKARKRCASMLRGEGVSACCRDSRKYRSGPDPRRSPEALEPVGKFLRRAVGRHGQFARKLQPRFRLSGIYSPAGPRAAEYRASRRRWGRGLCAAPMMQRFRTASG